MTTLAYGEKADGLYGYGNRPDAEVDPGSSGEHPLVDRDDEPAHDNAVFEDRSFEQSFLEDDTQPSVPSVIPPARPTPSPWRSTAPVALPAMVIGLVLASVVLVGLALCGIGVVWGASLSGWGRFALMVLGGYLLAVGIAALVAGEYTRPA